MSTKRILLKYPTRSRPDLFKSTLLKYISTAPAIDSIIVSIDRDDPTMNRNDMIQWIRDHGAEVFVGTSKSKIQAINADIPSDGWDILVLASDDHIPLVNGWADIVRNDMPDSLDALLWYRDKKQDDICLMPVMGKAWYDRRGYIYHPSYHSLWCDNEQTDVARMDGCLIKIDSELWSNESPEWGPSGIRHDKLYRRNGSFFQKDKINYIKRKAKGFPK